MAYNKKLREANIKREERERKCNIFMHSMHENIESSLRIRHIFKSYIQQILFRYTLIYTHIYRNIHKFFRLRECLSLYGSLLWFIAYYICLDACPACASTATDADIFASTRFENLRDVLLFLLLLWDNVQFEKWPSSSSSSSSTLCMTHKSFMHFKPNFFIYF